MSRRARSAHNKKQPLSNVEFSSDSDESMDLSEDSEAEEILKKVSKSSSKSQTSKRSKKTVYSSPEDESDEDGSFDVNIDDEEEGWKEEEIEFANSNSKRSSGNSKASKSKQQKKKNSSKSKRVEEEPDHTVLIGDKTVIERGVSYRINSDETMDVYVKYKNMSHYHCEWVPYDTALASLGKQRLKRLLDKPLYELQWSDEELFNPSYIKIDRVIDEGELEAGEVYYLVKWCASTYESCTWEKEKLVQELDSSKIGEFHERRAIPNEKLNPPTKRPASTSWKKLDESPVYKHGNTLRKYQLEGLNWLTYCWYHNQNSMLADEMGLGKTVQSTAFLYNLYQNCDIRGPFLIVTPLSTIGNWEREIKTWTSMNVVTYHGSEKARGLITNTEFYYKDMKGNDVKGAYKFDIILTTYEMAMTPHLKNIPWKVCVLDEAHRLKNKASKATEILKQYKMDHKVLLTGTPLQNSLEELWSLLNFLEPNKFESEEAFQKQFGKMSSAAEVEKLQEILKPLMLRRLKEDVETSIPVKEETIIEVELTTVQKKWYRSILEKNFGWLKQGASKRQNTPNLINTMMELRKCCIHPFLLKGAEDNILEELQATSPELQFQALIDSSGKMVLLDKLLKKLKEGGHKVLIFSQMTRCLDMIQDYLRGRMYGFERIDGSIRGEFRQAAIDRFCAPESDSFVFLLCTRAGGVGINLTVADTVIIFDSDWNPQNDLQAQSRCHRIGQTKQVQIYRLVMRNTYEREMFDRASLKLGLDKAILQRMDTGGDEESTSADVGGKTLSQLPKNEIEELLKKGAYGAFMDDEASKQFCEEDIDQILERRTQVIKHDQTEQKGSIFSKATFAVTNNDSNIEINDPDFWDKLAQKADLKVAEEHPLGHDLIVVEPRMRKQVQRFGIQDIDSEIGPDDDDFKERVGSVVPDSVFKPISGIESWKPWTPTEKTRFERVLMLYGFGSWDKMIVGFAKRTELDLKAAGRALILHVVEKGNPKPDAELAKDMHELLAKEFPIEVSGPNNDIPYPDATKKQIVEFRSILIDAPKEYSDHIERKGKTLLSRIQMLYFLRDKVRPEKNMYVPTVLGYPPTMWWGDEEDVDMMLGILKYGYGRYDLIRDDPELCFAKRTYKNVVRYDTSAYDTSVLAKDGEMEVDDADGEGVDISATLNEPSSSPIAQSIEPPPLENPQDPTAQPMETSEQSEAVEWPAAGALGKRIRSVMTAFSRYLAYASTRAAKEEFKRQQLEERAHSRSERSMKAAKSSNSLTRKEKLDFQRTIMTFGVETKAGHVRDWTRFKELAKIDKPDELLDEHYLKLITMCAKVIDKAERAATEGLMVSEIPEDGADAEGDDPNVPKAITPAQIRVEMDGDVMTFDKAQMMVKRIDQMRRLREEILVHPHLDRKLAHVKTNRFMPSWWNSYYDKCFLQGVARWGIIHNELMLTDPELPFKKLYDEYLEQQEKAGVHVENSDRFWMSDQVARGRLKALDEAVMNENVTPKKSRKRRVEEEDEESEDFDEFDDDGRDEMIPYRPKSKKTKAREDGDSGKKKSKKKESKAEIQFDGNATLSATDGAAMQPQIMENKPSDSGEVNDEDIAKLIKEMKKKKKKEKRGDDDADGKQKKHKADHEMITVPSVPAAPLPSENVGFSFPSIAISVSNNGSDVSYPPIPSPVNNGATITSQTVGSNNTNILQSVQQPSNPPPQEAVQPPPQQ
ncbi:choline dehydrogenase 7 [Nowakowskiella sp. JEL0407]|nr:choline dehydrogenase 7 [Nowakowskiella sp. JEL0407]